MDEMRLVHREALQERIEGLISEIYKVHFEIQRGNKRMKSVKEIFFGYNVL